jgi:hypothetical protein
MDDAASGCHPLDVTRVDDASVLKAVAMLYFALEDIGNRLDASMRMPGKALKVVIRIVRPKIVEKEKRIKLGNLIVTESSFEVHTRSFDGRPTLPDLLDSSITAHGSLLSQGSLRPSISQLAC